MYGLNARKMAEICDEIVSSQFQPDWDKGRGPKPSRKKYNRRKRIDTPKVILKAK